MTVETITNRPEAVSPRSAELEAILRDSAFAPIQQMAWIRVTGEDRVRWLNGMATNSIQALDQGTGCYNFFLNAQGRIQGDAMAWMMEDAILLETGLDHVSDLIAHLDRFIIMDDVELTDMSRQSAGLALIGPRSVEILQTLGLDAPAPLRLSQTSFEDARLDLLQTHSPLIQRFELWSTPGTIATITQTLTRIGIMRAGAESLEDLRLLEGSPLYGTDIRAKELPQETAQARALHFAKGCYLGQEIVERIRSRGNVHRTFSGFILTGALPPPGSSLFLEQPDSAVGEITSAAVIPLADGTVTLALGYIRREALEASNHQTKLLQYAGGTARPTALPYPISPDAQRRHSL